MRKTRVGIAVLTIANLIMFGCHQATHPSHRPDELGNAAPIKDVATQNHASDIHLEPYDAVDHLYRNAKSQLPSSVRLAVLDTADWAAIWKRIVGTGSPTSVPSVDFSREMRLDVGMGQAPWLGYP